jgi:hypothetical protein
MKSTIELEEWSGPVSPRFQWRVTLRIDDDAVDYEETGANALGPKKSKLSQKALDALWEELDAHKALERGGDLVGERKVGVSFNRLAIARGDAKMTLEYTLSKLDAPENADRKAIVAAIKAAARAVTSSA